MREVSFSGGPSPEAASFVACLATILELPPGDLPAPAREEDGVDWGMRRWLGGLGLGLVPIEDAASFSWAGPWIGWARLPDGERRAVVMFGVPAGVAWDPSGATEGDGWRLDGGMVVAALDIALARPALPQAPVAAGTVEAIFIAPDAGAPARLVEGVRALAGRGLEGDRHTTGKGTFPSGPPGSALTLIEAEVCESFAPALTADEHRRNLVTRDIDLNALVGHDFIVGEVPCRGTRLCEPCTVVDGYASRPILRPLVHRGGLRADILADGEIHLGDAVSAVRKTSRAQSPRGAPGRGPRRSSASRARSESTAVS
jgi:MOSC domain-containing protein YiiM